MQPGVDADAIRFFHMRARLLTQCARLKQQPSGEHLMPLTRSFTLFAVIGALVALESPAMAAPLTAVPSANPKATGIAVPNSLSPELAEKVIVQGAHPLENPAGQFAFYGYNNDGPHVPPPGSEQSKDNNVEATKTEPDKNTYLVLHA